MLIRMPSVKHNAVAVIRPIGKVAVALTLSFTLQCALAGSAASDCAAVSTAAAETVKAQKQKLTTSEEAAQQALENAKACIDRMLQLIRSMTPTLPSIQSISIGMIVDFLSNKVCSVAVNKVSTTLSPITGAVNGVIGGAVGTVNGAITGATGGLIGGAGGLGPIVSTGGGGPITSLPTIPDLPFSSPGGPPPAAPTAAPKAAQPEASVWKRLGCTFGSGAGC